MSRAGSPSKSGLLGKVVLTLLTIVICLGLLEVAVRIFIPVRNVGPAFSAYDPVYGKVNKRSFSAVRYTPEFDMTVTTNRLGFRGPEPVGPQSGAVLFIGDSFTLGYGVSDGEEFPARVRATLETRGTPIPVVNTGMGNNGNGRWVKWIENGDAAAYAPRLVVFQITENDFADNHSEGLFALKDSELVELPVPDPSSQRLLQEVVEALPFLSYSYLLGLVKQASTPDAMIGAPPAAREAVAEAPSAPADELTYRLIDRAVAGAKRRGWPVLGLGVDLRGRQRARIDQIFQAQSADLLHVPLKPDRPELYYRIDGHWNVEGHAHVAKMVLDWMDAHPNILTGTSTAAAERG